MEIDSEPAEAEKPEKFCVSITGPLTADQLGVCSIAEHLICSGPPPNAADSSPPESLTTIKAARVELENLNIIRQWPLSWCMLAVQHFISQCSCLSTVQPFASVRLPSPAASHNVCVLGSLHNQCLDSDISCTGHTETVISCSGTE